MKVTNTKIGAMMKLTNDIYAGCAPNGKECYTYLVDQLKVKHIINMRDGEIYYSNEHTKNHSLDYPDDASTWNESKLMKWLLTKAKSIAPLKGRIYIHNSTGRDEEVMLAFVVWALRDPKTCPENVQEWLQKNHYHLAIDNEERRRITVATIKLAKKPTLDRFFKK